jgi:hypothetical protein
MSASNRSLAGRIRRELEDIDLLVQRTIGLLELALRYKHMEILDGAALNLHSFYAAIERVFEDIVHELDDTALDGKDWHRRLLMQMTAEVPGVRPAVISKPVYQCLDEYLRFRHVVRNIYTHNLSPKRVQELVEALPDCAESVKAELLGFADFLIDTDWADAA